MIAMAGSNASGWWKKRFQQLLKTPLHPQWLLGSRTSSALLVSRAHGLVLDVGCADQWAKSNLTEECQYISLDYPETGKHLYRTTPDIFADISALPVKSRSCDTVLCLEVLEHVRTPQIALDELYRVLRPGGSLILSMPFIYPAHDEPHDYQRFTRHALVERLQRAGFEIVSLEPRLHSLEATGLVMCLALAGSAITAIGARSPRLLLALPVLLLIPFINLGSWILSLLLPSWNALAAGYEVVARKIVAVEQE